MRIPWGQREIRGCGEGGGVGKAGFFVFFSFKEAEKGGGVEEEGRGGGKRCHFSLLLLLLFCLFSLLLLGQTIGGCGRGSTGGTGEGGT